MTTSGSRVMEYLTAMENQGGVVVKDAPKFDLETYIQNYKGRNRFDRLLLVGQCSTTLCVDALKAAVAEAKKGRDINRYREVVELLSQAAPTEPEATLDRHWVEATEKSNKDETRRLEQELKGYRNNLVRESIRMGNEDIGRLLEAVGDLAGAAESYSRMRPDVSTTKHIVDVGKHLVRVHLQRREWPSVVNNLNKMSSVMGQIEDKGLPTYVKVMHGVALLGQSKYSDASITFLQADAATPPASYAEGLSANDVAIYGGLLALATMDRKEIQKKVLENHTFRAFLELEPHIRRAIAMFVNGRYSACLSVLEAYRPDYLLDIYLQKHIPTIYSQIRSKCISQYLIPFSCVTLESLNASFAVDGKSVEDELVTMIRSGVLNARINTIDKAVTTASVKPRTQMHVSALDSAREYHRDAFERVRRMNIGAAELEVRAPKNHTIKFQSALGQSGSSAPAGIDEWFDESSMQVA